MNAQLKPVPHFARESGRDVMGEIQPLLEEHAREVSHRPIPVACDYEKYLKIEALGALRIFTVRMSGALVGYAIFQVAHNMHFKSNLEARMDTLFLSAPYRKGMLGVRFLKWVDQQLWAEPRIDEVHLHGKLMKDIEPLYEHLGYERIYYVHSKRRHGV